MVALEAEIHEIAGGPFNIASNKQLADVLFGKLSLPVGRRTKTGPSTDADTLEELAALHPVPAEGAGGAAAHVAVVGLLVYGPYSLLAGALVLSDAQARVQALREEDVGGDTELHHLLRYSRGSG